MKFTVKDKFMARLRKLIDSASARAGTLATKTEARFFEEVNQTSSQAQPAKRKRITATGLTLAALLIIVLIAIGVGCGFSTPQWFQTIGLALAAGAATASLVKSKGFEERWIEEEGTRWLQRRLTPEARMGVYCLIAGLLVSLIARAFEQSANNRHTEEAQVQASNQLSRAELQINLATNALARLTEQSTIASNQLGRAEEQLSQSATILSNVQQESAIAAKSLDKLSEQSLQTADILARVQEQAAVANHSLDVLAVQGEQTRSIIKALQQSQIMARQQVQELERAASQLETVRITAVFELPINHPDLKSLATYVRKYVKREWPGSREWAESQGPLEIYGILASYRGIPIPFQQYVARDQRDDQVRSFLGRTQMILVINKKHTPTDKIPVRGWDEKSDLIAFGGPPGDQLLFFPKTDRLVLQRSNITFHRTDWTANGTIASLRDLSDAEMIVAYDRAALLTFDMPLLALEVNFNNHPVTLLHPQVPRHGDTVYVHTLPPAEQIINLQAHTWPIMFRE